MSTVVLILNRYYAIFMAQCLTTPDSLKWKAGAKSAPALYSKTRPYSSYCLPWEPEPQRVQEPWFRLRLSLRGDSTPASIAFQQAGLQIDA